MVRVAGTLRPLYSSCDLDSPASFLQPLLARGLTATHIFVIGALLWSAGCGHQQPANESTASASRGDDPVRLTHASKDDPPSSGVTEPSGEPNGDAHLATLRQMTARGEDDLTQALYANRFGFRSRATRQTRDLLRRGSVPLPLLIAITHPTRPAIDFAAKPELENRQQMREVGVMNALYALSMHGDACESLDVAGQHPLADARDPEYLAMLFWLYTSCQRFDIARQVLQDAPESITDYPAFWMGLGQWLRNDLSFAASDASTTTARISPADCFRMALRLEPNHRIAARSAIASLSSSDSQLAGILEASAANILTVQTIVNDLVVAPHAPPALVGRLAQELNAGGRYAEAIAWQWWLSGQMGAPPQRVEALRDGLARILKRHPEGYDWDRIVGPIAVDELRGAANSLLRSLQSPQDVHPPNQQAIDSGGNLSRERSESIPANPPAFDDVSASLGESIQWIGFDASIEKDFQLHQPLGGGAAWPDYDRDGRPDLFLAQAGVDAMRADSRGDLLFRNLSNDRVAFVRCEHLAHASDADQPRNYTHGVTFGDWNQDGFPDLATNGVGSVRMWINQGDGTFVADPAFVADETLGREPDAWNGHEHYVGLSLAIADLDDDRLPDCYVAGYVDDPDVFRPIELDADQIPINLPSPLHFRPATDRIISLASDQTIARVRDLPSPATGMGLMIGDLGGDGRTVTFVTNDQMPNHLWDFDRDDGFVDLARVRGLAVGGDGTPTAAMGIATDDLNADARPDLVVTNFFDQWSNVYLSRGDSGFVDRAVGFGLASSTGPMVGFGTQFLDWDQNGWRDLIIANGHIEDLRSHGEDFRMPLQCFAQSDQGFSIAVPTSKSGYFDQSHLARGVQTADIDGDSRLDFVVTGVMEPIRLFRNRTESVGQSLRIELVGTDAERSAVGSTVTVTRGGTTRAQSMTTGDGYLGRNESALFFCFPRSGSPVQVSVRWAGDETTQQWTIPSRIGSVLLIQGDPSSFPLSTTH